MITLFRLPHARPRAAFDPSELAQAKIRIVNVSSFCSYLLLAWYFDWQHVSPNLALGATAYILYALLWLPVVRLSLFKATQRRIVAAILDQAMPALGMYLAGFLAALVAWVPALGSVGSGLRFGSRYTVLSSAVGAPLLGLAFFFSPDWSTIPAVAGGILMCNLLLPLYIVFLVKRLEQDKRTFETRAAHFEAATKKDALTGVLNRTGFAGVMDDLLVTTQSQNEKSAVLLLDLDGFKSINDTCGHAAGDDVLKAVAAALTGCLRVSDHVARLGGDEFGVLLRHLSNDHGAEVLAADMLQAIARVSTPLVNFRLGASIGICVLPDPALRSRDEILDAADRLMYEAKAAGKNQFRILNKGSMRISTARTRSAAIGL